MVVTMSLIVALTALVIPCWGVVIRSRSKQAAVSLVLESLEQARQTAITKKSDVWVIFQHPAGGACDSLRLLSRQGNSITPLGVWQRLPGGITFRSSSDSLMQQRPPGDLLLSSFNAQAPPEGSLFGSVMFQHSGRIAVPLPGGPPLVLGLNAKASPLPESIMLSRATGRATYQ